MNFKALLIFIILLTSAGTAFAWEFNGTARDIDGNLLNNTLINITIWSMSGPGGMSLVGANSTYSNASGWFNLSVDENGAWNYKPVVKYRNSTTNALDYVGQSLPEFPFREFANTSGINFYLRPAGTINITAINSSGDRISFRYQVKDTRLGYPIAESLENNVSEAIVYVPRDRNYSIMIYPDQAVPISFNWNNFSSDSSYDFSDSLSSYNVTTHTVQKTFNATDKLIRLTGYIQNLSEDDFADWNEFAVVPYLLEPGDMIYIGEDAGLPYNMSAWGGSSDIYNLTSGFYNITLPGPAESATYILFATARNGSRYYGSYRNLTLSYSDSSTELNFTMRPLMSTDWGSLKSNITLNDAITWQKINISSARQQFNLVNSSNSTLSNANMHIELTVDYEDYGSMEFTFVMDVGSSDGNASFYVPLLNLSIKEINIYSQSYSPKRVSAKTAEEILSNPNITMSEFNPGDIDGSDIAANVRVALYNSNSTCNLPNPPDSCIIADSASMDESAEDHFNPLSSIIGGGKLNFRMGLLSSGIIVEYINVDMLASGPPDALFDDSATTSTSGNFDSAMRFGSNGPTIYDYVMVSMPYTEGSTSQTGLDENSDVNMSIQTFYDENWNSIWDTSLNGTDGAVLAGNYSHYSEHASEWSILMSDNNCLENQSELNSTSPCYIDTSENRIWIRLPHFSGTQPNIVGSVITAESTSTSPGSSSSSGGNYPTFKPGEEELNAGYTKVLYKYWKVSFKLNNASHLFKVEDVNKTYAKISVSSEKQEETLQIGQEKKFELSGDNYYDLLVRLNSIKINSANFTLQTIHEEMKGQEGGEEKEAKEKEPFLKKSWRNSLIILLIVIALIAVIAFAAIYYKKSKNRFRFI